MGGVMPQFVPETAADGSAGRSALSILGQVHAGAYSTFTLTYAAGPSGIASGGSIRFGTPNTGWGRPYLPESRYWYTHGPVEYLRKNARIDVKSAVPVSCDTWVDKKMMRYDPPGGHWRWWMVVRLSQGMLDEGDVVTFTYGDTRGGEPGAQVQKFPERGVDFTLLVDPGGNGEFVHPVGSPHVLDVTAGPPEVLKVTVPSIVRAGETHTARIAQLDNAHNRANDAFLSIVLRSDAEVIGGKPTKLVIPDNSGGIDVDFTPGDDQSMLRFEAKGELPGPGPRIWAESNPAVVRSPAQADKLFWGDLHSQSIFHGPGAWSVGTPAECYEYAREVAHLDFLAVTDDTTCLRDAWFDTQQAARDAYEPGRFVSVKAFEWCSKIYGHRNVYYRTDAPEDIYPESVFRGSSEDFFSYFRDKDVIMVPHHTLVWTDWRNHDPLLEPLVEIYSCWGSSESVQSTLWDKSRKTDGGAQAALALGYRLGFVGGTDTHAGTPGKSLASSERFAFHPYKGGLTGLYAPELTRDSIFEAMKKRRTYATTGVRIILNFSVDGASMGSISQKGDSSKGHLVNAEIYGSDRVRTVELLRNNDVIDIRHYREDNVVYQWETPAVDGDEQFYLRVTQSDGNIAWSSPVWCDVI